MKVKDAMHKGVDWVSPDTPLTELAKLMREHDIGAIPIGENDRPRHCLQRFGAGQLRCHPRDGARCDDPRHPLLPG
jgi:CBS domain-containing protein